jgi:hypothetical protein
MKIYVLGSNSFMKEMVACSAKLREHGYEGWIHPDYEAFVRGEKQDILKRALSGEHAAVIRENDYLKTHYRNIQKSDAVLIINAEKKGKKNYIGGSVLIEMGQSYVNDKKIFLLNDIPRESAYLEEIEAMDPICLQGDLNNIKKYV